jgi:hypothetical protein
MEESKIKDLSYIVSDFNEEYIGVDLVVMSEGRQEVFTIEADYSVKNSIDELCFDSVNNHVSLVSDSEQDCEIVVESFDVYDQHGQISYKLDEIYSENELESFLTKLIHNRIMFSHVIDN